MILVQVVAGSDTDDAKISAAADRSKCKVKRQDDVKGCYTVHTIYVGVIPLRVGQYVLHMFCTMLRSALANICQHILHTLEPTCANICSMLREEACICKNIGHNKTTHGPNIWSIFREEAYICENIGHDKTIHCPNICSIIRDEAYICENIGHNKTTHCPAICSIYRDEAYICENIEPNKTTYTQYSVQYLPNTIIGVLLGKYRNGAPTSVQIDPWFDTLYPARVALGHSDVQEA
jgi:hypothetical protein